jgi:hypothetical protein
MNAPRISLPVLNVQSAAHDVQAKITADLPALGLIEGQAVTLRPLGKPDCDCLYLLADASFCRLQFWGGDTFRKVDAAGAVEIVPMGAVQIAARVIVRRSAVA